jgi:Ca-activated chloride channel family protein
VLGLGVTCVAALLAWAPAPQRPEPIVRILAPEEGAYVSGEVIIRATVEPKGQPVDRMTFFADGQLVCTVDAEPFECGWNAGATIREHLVRVVAYLPGGGSVKQSVRTKEVEYAETVHVDMVQVTITVTEGNRFVRGLPREAFRVYEDDVSQPIRHFAAENIPLELIVGIDVSESMADAIGQVRDNVKRFLAALRPTDRVTVLAFNQAQFIIARPTLDLAARLKAVDRLDTWGSTALHDVVIKSFDLLGRQPGRRGLVMFTDGDDTSSRAPRDVVERRAETSDALLYMIGQGRAVGSVPLRELCERLAAKSGGRAFFPRNVDGLGDVFDAIVEELSNQYLLTYAPPSAVRDETWHRIRVDVEDGNRYQVRARQGYRFTAGPPS